VPPAVLAVLGEDPAPWAAQCITNLLDSPGAMKTFPEPAQPRAIIAAAAARGVGVMGIRAVQAGALTDAIDRDLPADHPEMADYHRAESFRALAKGLGQPPAVLAHRYALSMPGVSTVVLGVKDQRELQECLVAAEAGPLPADLMNWIDASVAPRVQSPPA
jgi:aryl-alcohol dehydrogenase-like predicted oxidoreductase